MLDFRDYYNPVLGMNLTVGPVTGYTYQIGDVRLGLTTANQAAGDGFIIFYDIVQLPLPYAW